MPEQLGVMVHLLPRREIQPRLVVVIGILIVVVAVGKIIGNAVFGKLVEIDRLQVGGNIERMIPEAVAGFAVGIAINRTSVFQRVLVTDIVLLKETVRTVVDRSVAEEKHHIELAALIARDKAVDHTLYLFVGRPIIDLVLFC